MTTYYISPNGSDSNNGLGPDASHGTNKPWLTVSKSVTSGTPVLPGDTVYIAPGYYYSMANVNPLIDVASVASPTQWVGDPTNAQGFKDGSGARLAPGLAWLTTRTSGEGLNSTIASTAALFDFTGNSPSGMQFKRLVLEVSLVNADPDLGVECPIIKCKANSTNSTDILLEDCRIYGCVFAVAGWLSIDAGRNYTIRRCTIFSASVLSISGGTAGSANADLNVVLEESLIFGHFFRAFEIGSGATIGGGLYFYNNTFIASAYWAAFLRTTALKISTTKPLVFKGNLFISGTEILNAGTSGQISDAGYNRFLMMGSGPALTNVTLSGNSLLGSALNLVLPDLVKLGLEMPRSDFLGWTDAAHVNQKFSASGLVTADFRGRTVRPWGAGASIGYMQAQDVTQDTASAITGGGTNSLKLTGAGEVSLYIPVDATGFTASVRTKSTSYGGTNYPQMIVVANPSVGVTTDTTVTAAAATEETITTATITPTSKGVMEVRLISRSSSTTSTTHFDLLTSA